MVEGIAKGIGALLLTLFIVCIVSVPLALWKLIELIVWACRHVRISATCWLCALSVLSGSTAFAAQFTLTWTDNSSNEDGFVIERAPGLNATTGFLAIGMVGKDVKTFVDPGLPASVGLSYRVFAYNVAGRSGYSNTASGTSSTIPAGLTPPPAPSGGTLQADTPYTPPVLTLQAGQSVTVAAAPPAP